MFLCSFNWPLTRYVKLRVAHAPGIPGAFSPPPTSKETANLSRHASRHVRHPRAVMHAGIANPRWRGKRSRQSRRMRNPQLYVSGKRPMIRTAVLHVYVWVFMETRQHVNKLCKNNNFIWKRKTSLQEDLHGLRSLIPLWITVELILFGVKTPTTFPVLYVLISFNSPQIS